MNTKKLAIFIIILIIILSGLFLFFYFTKDKKPTTNTTIDDSFFPTDSGFGVDPINNNTNNPNTDPDIDSFVDTDNTQDPIILTLRKLSDEPTSAVYIYNYLEEIEQILLNEEGVEEIIIEEVDSVKFQTLNRRDGHVREYDSKKSGYVVISNKSIVAIRNAFIGSGGFIFQYLSDFGENIISYLGQIEETAVEIESGVDEEGNPILEEKIVREFVGSFLPENIISSDLSPGKDSLVYVVEDIESSNIFTTPLSSYSPTQIATIPLKQVQVFWTNDGFFIQTNADSRAPGHLFKLNDRGDLTVVLDNVYGLTALPSPNGDKIFVSYYAGTGITTSFLDTETLEQTNTSIKTLPEKCVWSRAASTYLYCGGMTSVKGEFPEDWYMGKTFFSDVLWILDSNTGYSEVISYLDENDVNEPFDIIKPQLSEGDEYLLFINKYNRKPWVLDIKQYNRKFIETGTVEE